MGVKQSKRSVDITEVSTKGEIEGFGNEGKVEKIVDGVVEKLAANGHVDGELQNGGELQQNNAESVKNGEAQVVVEKILEKKEEEVLVSEGAINGQAEPSEINGEAEKGEEEEKKSEDKKEKKKEKKEKEKKEKAVKKKFSFRNFSFSKKDKSKPSKEEKSPEKVDEAGNEDVPKSPETDESIASPITEGEKVVIKAEESIKIETSVPLTAVTNTTAEQNIPESVEPTTVISNAVAATKAAVEDIPPPLPISPPPSETVDTKMNFELVNSIEKVPESLAEHMESVVTATINSLDGNVESNPDVLKDPEQIAIETGRQIEEKATNLLKTVEESMRNVGESVSKKSEDGVKIIETGLSYAENGEANNKELQNLEKVQEISEEGAKSLPVPDFEILTSKTEETENKKEEYGGGEELADIPKELMEELNETENTDSIETPKTLPPPLLEASTGE